MRTVFLLAVIVVLFVDAFFYSGGYTQAAWAQVVAAADYLMGLINDAVDTTTPEPEA